MSSGASAEPPVRVDDCHPGQALEVERCLRVSSHRCVGIDRDRHVDLFRFIRNEPEPCHLANADAVEKHRRPGQEARNRVVEPHLIIGALPKPARRFEPIDKGESRHDGGEGKEPDQNVACLDFHWT